MKPRTREILAMLAVCMFVGFIFRLMVDVFTALFFR